MRHRILPGAHRAEHKVDEEARKIHIPDPASVPCLLDSFAVEWVPEQALA